jgi:hypothetical protein
VERIVSEWQVKVKQIKEGRRKTEVEPFSQIRVSQTVLLSDPFWYRKITKDVLILAHVNIGCPDDG